jgi:hypothetical protein
MRARIAEAEAGRGYEVARTQALRDEEDLYRAYGAATTQEDRENIARQIIDEEGSVERTCC